MNFLVVITTMVGFYMASPGRLDWRLLLHTLLGTALTAAGASVLNQFDRARSRRAHAAHAKSPPPRRPNHPPRSRSLAASRSASSASSISRSPSTCSPRSSALHDSRFIVFVYTPLKRVTTLNTVIGAIPGAIPPLMGFAAVNNALSPEALAVFAILFLWQMPHFLAIAILYKRDYAGRRFQDAPRASMRTSTRDQCNDSFICCRADPRSALLPTLLGMSGQIYFTAALLLGLAFFSFCVTCATTRQRTDARQLFFASIIYLPLLMAAMMYDKL